MKEAAVDELVRDFVTSSRLLAAGDSESALECLLPRDGGAKRRVLEMVAVGAMVTGSAWRTKVGTLPSADTGDLADRFVAAGAQLDTATIRDLIAAHCGSTADVDEDLVDTLAELAARFAKLDRGAS